MIQPPCLKRMTHNRRMNNLVHRLLAAPGQKFNTISVYKLEGRTTSYSSVAASSSNEHKVPSPKVPDYEYEYGRTKMRGDLTPKKKPHSPYLDHALKNPFLMFMDEKYDTVNQLHPDMTITDIVARLSSLWKLMPAVEKDPYVEFYNKGEVQHLEYKAFLTEEELEGLRKEEQERERVLINKIDAFNKRLDALKEDKPTQPPTAFMLFSKEHMPKCEGTFENKIQAVASAWEKMVLAEKKSYQDEEFALRDKYAKDWADWEEATAEDGRRQEILLVEEEINTLRDLEKSIFRARITDWFKHVE